LEGEGEVRCIDEDSREDWRRRREVRGRRRYELEVVLQWRELEIED